MRDRSIGRSRTEARRASHAFLILPMAKARGCSVHRLDHRPGALQGPPGPGGPCRRGGGVAAQTLVSVWHPCPRRVRPVPHGNDSLWNAPIRCNGQGAPCPPNPSRTNERNRPGHGPFIPGPEGRAFWPQQGNTSLTPRIARTPTRTMPGERRRQQQPANAGIIGQWHTHRRSANT